MEIYIALKAVASTLLTGLNPEGTPGSLWLTFSLFSLSFSLSLSLSLARVQVLISRRSLSVCVCVCVLVSVAVGVCMMKSDTQRNKTKITQEETKEIKLVLCALELSA